MKTKQIIENARKCLLSFYNPTFTYQQAVELLEKNGIHKMNLYYFVYSNAIKKISRGVYEKTNFLETVPVEYLLDCLKNRRKIKYIKVNQKKETIIPKNSEIKINDSAYTTHAVDHLKSLGYRILKPINKFEEI